MKSPPKNQAEADEIRKKAFSNQLLKGQMFSKDAKVMCIYLRLTQKLLSYRIYQELTQKINSFEKGSESFHIAGLPVAECDAQSPCCATARHRSKRYSSIPTP